MQDFNLFLAAAASARWLTTRGGGGGHRLLMRILGGASCIQLVLTESSVLCPHLVELFLGVRDALPQLVY